MSDEQIPATPDEVMLAYVREHPNCRPRDVLDATGITADEASAAWASLEKDGHIVSTIDHGEVTFAPVEVEPPA
jgi:predicted transcriptional regulator